MGTQHLSLVSAVPALLRAACGGGDIGLPTGGATVINATPMAVSDAGNVRGGYCQVRRTIAPVYTASPSINLVVNLPLQWNHRRLSINP